MSDHDYNPVPQLPAGPEPFLNKAGSNTLALMFQAYRKRCKSNSRYVGIFRINRYRGKENMPYNLVLKNGDKREPGYGISIISEGPDKPRFTVLAKGLEINPENFGYIGGNFRSNKKRIHPVL
jgi:hypothetical protein